MLEKRVVASEDGGDVGDASEGNKAAGVEIIVVMFRVMDVLEVASAMTLPEFLARENKPSSWSGM